MSSFKIHSRDELDDKILAILKEKGALKTRSVATNAGCSISAAINALHRLRDRFEVKLHKINRTGYTNPPYYLWRAI
jgi:hypothetical protein